MQSGQIIKVLSAVNERMVCVCPKLSTPRHRINPHSVTLHSRRVQVDGWKMEKRLNGSGVGRHDDGGGGGSGFTRSIQAHQRRLDRWQMIECSGRLHFLD